MYSNPAAPSRAKTLPAITVWANANTILTSRQAPVLDGSLAIRCNPFYPVVILNKVRGLAKIRLHGLLAVLVVQAKAASANEWAKLRHDSDTALQA